MNFRKFIIFITGTPEFKITESREGNTVYLGYGNDRYFRFHWNRRNIMASSLDFHLFSVKGSFKVPDVEGSANSGSSYGCINKAVIIVLFSER